MQEGPVYGTSDIIRDEYATDQAGTFRAGVYHDVPALSIF
jgi:hypothetical protein